MALKGTLKDFGLADIFQLIGIQRKTGVLVLINGDRRVTVSFLAGAVVSADSSERALEERLGAVLVKSGKITARRLEEALKTQKQTLQRLGKILIDLSAISEDDLREALRVQVTQIVHHLFRWRDGEYDFSQEETIDYDREHFVPIAAETILMEGARMVDEWPIIERRVRSYDLVVRRKSNSAAAASGPVSVYETDINFDLMMKGDPKADEEVSRLSEEETVVYGLIDGRSTVQDIIDRCHLGEFDTCRILYEMMTRDLVEEGLSEPPRPAARVAPPALSALFRGGLAAMAVMSALSLYFAFSSPLSPFGRGDHDPFAIDRIRTHLSQARVGRIDQAIRTYHLERQTIPATLESLVQEGFLLGRDLIDPWGRGYGFELEPSGYAITGYDRNGQPDDTVSVQSQFVGTQRLALEGSASGNPLTR